MEDLNEESTDDEELDVTSRNFNPLKAIYSKKLKIPPKSCQQFDNVSQFLSRLKRADNAFDADLSKPLTHYKKSGDKTEAVDPEKYHVTSAGRMFPKEQGKKFSYALLTINLMSFSRSSGSSWSKGKIHARHFC